MAVVLEHRAATGDVVDDRVESLHWKRGQVLVGERSCRLARAGVKVDRTAADLRLRHMHVAAILLQHAGGRPIHVAEHRVADAAGEQRDRRPAPADRRQKLRQRSFVPLRRRQHVDHLPQLRRQQVRQPRRLQQLQQAQSAVRSAPASSARRNFAAYGNKPNRM